jgi:hypothetical protein
MSAYAFVCGIDCDPVLPGGDPFGLFNDDPRFQGLLQLHAELLQLMHLRGVDQVAAGHSDVLI